MQAASGAFLATSLQFALCSNDYRHAALGGFSFPPLPLSSDHPLQLHLISLQQMLELRLLGFQQENSRLNLYLQTTPVSLRQPKIASNEGLALLTSLL